MLPALQAIGQTAISGFQSGHLLGSAYVPATIDPAKATRSSSESSFLNLALGNTTLKVYNNSLAQILGSLVTRLRVFLLAPRDLQAQYKIITF